jgi:hypothetical protein
MNTEEVVAMMDAITEGRDCVLHPKGIDGYQGITIGIFDDGILFSTEDDPSGIQINDPRTVREIAGALVAWATRKDQLVSWDVAKSLTIFGHDLRSEQSGGVGGTDATFPSVSDWAAIKSGTSSRAEWYRRNVDRMTQEIKDRNLRDLRAILSDPMTRHEEHPDIQAAIMILLNAGAR